MYYTYDLEPKLESITFYSSGRYIMWADDSICPGVEIGQYSYDPSTRQTRITAIERDGVGDCGFAVSGNLDSFTYDALEVASDGNYVRSVYQGAPVEGNWAQVQDPSNPIVGAWGDGEALSIVFDD
jgi:hypothetical protein